MISYQILSYIFMLYHSLQYIGDLLPYNHYWDPNFHQILSLLTSLPSKNHLKISVDHGQLVIVKILMSFSLFQEFA